MNNVVESLNVGNDDKQIKATSMGSMKKDVEKVSEITKSSGNNEEPMVAEPVTITIELDETSCEEVLEQTQQAKAITNDASIETPLQTKATEFVIVSTTSIDCGNKMSDVKDELADPITSEDVFENDPMGILTELNDRSITNSSSRSNVDLEEAADDSSTGSSSVHTISSSTNIMEWSKEHPWLLYEECDEMYGYCLYCDVKLSVRSLSSVKQHGISLYHKERSDNYLAFREEEERNNLGTPLFEIKQEFGTDSYISALKLKRKTQAEALNNYNWRRWLEECPWLERDNNAGTVGRCKYCGIRINVEFSYLRTRHQETGKHKEFEKTHNNITPYQRSADDEAEDAQHNSKSSNERYRWGEPVEDQHATLRCKICDTKVAKNNFLRHLRTISHLQNEEKYLNSLKSKRAKRTKVIPNLENTEGISPKTPHSWDMYSKQHPWLIADPTDVSYAFCKYCEKRVLYGNSAAKRATHENSMQHKNQEKLYSGKKKERKVGTVEETKLEGSTGEDVDDYDETEEENDEDEEEKGEDENNPRDEENNTQRKDDGNDDGEESKVNEESEEDDADDDGAEEDEDEAEEDEDEAGEDEDEAEENDAEEDDEEEEDDEDKEEEDEVDEDGDTVKQGKNDKQDFAAGDQNESKKRITRNNPKWYDQYPWCKKYKADPVNYCFCSYCKIVISKTCNRVKHSKTGRHRAAEAEFLRRQSKKKSLLRSKIPEDSFEWAVDIKSQLNLYYCKYCRVRISRRYSRKQHSVSKIHQINENLFKANRRKLVKPEPNVEAPAYSQQRSDSSSLTKDAVKVPSFITLVKQWQKKFSWLTYKRIETRSNYAFCKVCEQSLYLRSIKSVIKHGRSGKHVRTANQLRRQKLQQEREQEEFNNTQELRKRPKREAEPSTSSHLEILKKRTEELNRISKESSKGNTYKSSLAEMQKRFSWIEKSKKPEYAHCRYCDDDIYLKILFLRNHSNSHKHRQAVIKFRIVSTKREKRRHSESNAENEDDDDIVLVEDNAEEVLISEQDDNWTVKSENMDEHEALDYLLQRSGKTAENNVSHRHASATEDRSKRAKRSHSIRRLNDNNASLVASILSTPLTLASCLGPLIQQQIQQQVANPLTAATTAATPPAAPTVLEAENSYDLFFKSVSETMKKLPTDLAAEGKVKVMQVICDLELKALKRKNLQTNNEKEPTENAVIVNSLANANSTRPGEGTEASARGMADVETVITPLYSGVDTSPVSNHQQKVTVSSVVSTPSISITSTEGNKEKSLNANQSPIIGVMDKNGLHTLQFKNSAVVKQVPKANVAPNNSPAMSSSSIRCIPFKNLTQNVSTEGNTKITRIQMPLTTASPSTPATAPTHTSQTPQSTSNMNATNTPKGMLNLRSIHITKRSAPQTTTVSPVVTTSVSDKNPQGTYITTNVQRWTPVNGVSPTGNIKKQTSNPNFQLSAKQSSTPIARNYQ